MKYRNVGNSGLKVSEIALGSWMTDLNGNSKAKIAADTLRLAYENGINFFDCADAYSGGMAERFLGNQTIWTCTTATDLTGQHHWKKPYVL